MHGVVVDTHLEPIALGRTNPWGVPGEGGEGIMINDLSNRCYSNKK